MSRWFRYYDDALDDPKVQRLSGDLFKAWVNLLSVASKRGGQIPSLSDAAFGLRMPEAKASLIVTELSHAGLLDRVTDGYFEPHNWSLRQFKADVTDPTVANRMRNYRNRKRNGDRNDTVTVTPTRTDTESDTEQKGSELRSEGGAPSIEQRVPSQEVVEVDPRTDLFNRGKQILEEITGGADSSCRSQIGRWLKMVNDESIHVLAAIEEAKRERRADPSAWITKVLQNRGGNHGTARQGRKPPNAITAALDAQLERLERQARDGDEVRPPPPRLLSHR